MVADSQSVIRDRLLDRLPEEVCRANSPVGKRSRSGEYVPPHAEAPGRVKY